VHSENDWGITLDGDSESVPQPATVPSELPEGLQFRFEKAPIVEVAAEDVVDTGGADLEALRAKFASLKS